jgi:hypothetical protein
MEQDNFGRFISDIERSGDRLLEKLVGKMAQRAKRYAPQRTGRLRRSIKPILLSNRREGRVITDVPYAGVMESGSKPHLIHGVKANFRMNNGHRFVWNDPKYGPIGEEFDPYNPAGGREAAIRGHHRRQGQRGTGRRGSGGRGYMNWTYEHGATVHHPGTKPHYFMRRAFNEVWPEARAVMREAYHR